MKNITPIALGISLAISSFAYAEEGFRQHSAHVHGHVELNIAQDGKELLMEISAPGADVVGFEHAPKTSEQKHQLENAITTLKDVNNLFAFPASAGCVALNQSVAHTLEGGDGHDKHDHNEHKHHDEHDHDEHSGHGEFNIEYSYTCSNISALKNIETQWFKHFSNTKSITVNWLSPDGKISVIELGKGDKTISR